MATSANNIDLNRVMCIADDLKSIRTIFPSPVERFSLQPSAEQGAASGSLDVPDESMTPKVSDETSLVSHREQSSLGVSLTPLVSISSFLTGDHPRPPPEQSQGDGGNPPKTGAEHELAAKPMLGPMKQLRSQSADFPAADLPTVGNENLPTLLSVKEGATQPVPAHKPAVRPSEVGNVSQLPCALPVSTAVDAAEGPIPSPMDRLITTRTSTGAVDTGDQSGYVEKGGFDPKIASLPYDLPRKSKRFSVFDFFLFVFCFMIPAAVAVTYFGFIASKQYISEFRFNVIDTSNSASSLAGGLSSVLGGAGLGSSASENYTVTDYITSPQAIFDVSKKIALKSYFTSPSVDWWARLSPSASQEKFVLYWQKMVSSDYDPVTGIATAQVRAFDPTAAHTISQTLMQSAEALVNEMQTRRYSDSVRFAQFEVDRATNKLKDLRQQMLGLRNKTNVVDPSSSAVAENIQLAMSLRLSLVTLESQLASISSAPKSPQIPPLKERIKATDAQLAKVDREISSSGGSRKLSKVVGDFESLTADETLALQELTGDLANLIQARATADAQHIYIMSYVNPTSPMSSTIPNRPLSIALAILICAGFYSLMKLLSIIVRSHAV